MPRRFIWKSNIPKRIISHAQQGMMTAADKIYNRAQTYTPFDNGELTLGARVTSEGMGTDTLDVVISYGNNEISKDYALLQHEDLSYRHNSPEQAKFLERACNEESSMIQYYILNRIRI